MSESLGVILVGEKNSDNPVAKAFNVEPLAHVIGWVSPTQEALSERMEKADIIAFQDEVSLQPALAALALRAGKSVWLRQPLAANLEAIRELDDAVADAQGVVGVASRAFTQPVVEARNAIDRAEIGIPFAVNYDLIGSGTDLGALAAACGAVLHILGGVPSDIFASSTWSAGRGDGRESVALSIGIGPNASATVIMGEDSASLGSYESVRLRGTRGSLTADNSRRPFGASALDSQGEHHAGSIKDLLAVIRGDRGRVVHDYAAARLAWDLARAARRSATEHSLIRLDGRNNR